MPAYEDRIARTGEDVSRQVGLALTVSGIIWLDRSLLGRVNSDDCIFAGGKLILPKKMAGKLEPDEWRPLMASSLFYRRRLAWNMQGDFVYTVLMSPIIAILGAIIVLALSHSFVVVLVYLFLGLGVFLAHRMSHSRKKLRLRSDIEAARITGGEVFTSVLRKIEALEGDETRKERR